jgi:hypothetical protein
MITVLVPINNDRAQVCKAPIFDRRSAGRWSIEAPTINANYSGSGKGYCRSLVLVEKSDEQWTHPSSQAASTGEHGALHIE